EDSPKPSIVRDAPGVPPMPASDNNDSSTPQTEPTPRPMDTSTPESPKENQDNSGIVSEPMSTPKVVPTEEDSDKNPERN
ncbi:MAG: hypothetical protein WD471_00855, partial [Candidatus Paceibacterota bacterium]